MSEPVGRVEYYNFLTEATKQMSDQISKALSWGPGVALTVTGAFATQATGGGAPWVSLSVALALFAVSISCHLLGLHSAQSCEG